jgi:mannose-6-phosphate isomerase-like protein (cupin superfamily)
MQDPMEEFSHPQDVKATKLTRIFKMKPRANAEKPGRSLSVVWDGRFPLVREFINQYSYVVRFTLPDGKAGNHYHEHKQEMFYALHGRMTVILEDIDTKVREKHELSSGDNQILYVPIRVAHVVISNTSDDALLVTASYPEANSDEFPYVLAK